MILRIVLVAMILFLTACTDDPPTGEETQSYCDYLRYKLEDRNFIEDPIIRQNVAQRAEILQEYQYFDCNLLMNPLPK